MNVANRYSVTLDVNKAKYTINSPIGLREGDSGTATIVATILDNGAAYSGMTSAQFFAQKPDGTAVATDPATVSGNTITYKVTNNLTTASGHVVNAYFLINKSVSTESFEINIHPSITLHGPSKDYIPGLNDLTRVWQQTINEWQGKFDELKAQLENTDYAQIIKDSLNTALDEAKEAYQAQFSQAVSEVNDTVKALEAKGVEADTEIAKLKTKQDDAETVSDSLQATVDQLNKKILDIDNWLDSLHDEFTAKNETYMKSMQAELTEKLADMKASSDSALNVVKGNISTAQSDIDGIDNKIVSLNQTLADVSKSVADINVPQIKADVDKANATANKALTAADAQATDIKNKYDALKDQLDLAAQNISGVRTNLYTDTQDFNNLSSWYTAGSNPFNFWTKITDTYNRLAVMQTTSNWNGLSQYIQVKKGDILTYSAYVENTSGTGTSKIYWQLDNSPEGSYSTATANPSVSTVNITDSWQRVSSTMVATSDGYLRPRLERTDNNTNTLQIAGIKVEKGSVPTDWCPNPSEIATNNGVQTAITNALDEADYSTSSEVDSKISTIDTNYVKKSELNTLIATALKDYLKTADLKQANYDAGFHSDWYGTEAEYNAITTKDAHVNYHTKEEG